MTIQILKDLLFPNGIQIRAGAVLNVPDEVGKELIDSGKARPHEKPGPREIKGGGRMNPGDPLPPPIPYVRVPTDPQPAASYEPGAYEDQDNFVRNLVTFAYPYGYSWWDDSTATPPPPVVPSDSASGRAPVLTLDQIKLHCHIEQDQTVEDPLLTNLEMAARLHTENYLRYQIDDQVGENIKQAMLLLVAHLYRNREAVTSGRAAIGAELPLGYEALLFPERDFPIY